MVTKKYVTESESIYIIDFEAKTWQRIKGPKAATIRTDSGEFNSFSIEPDNTIRMICPPINPPFPRIITSTILISEEEIG
jgi:hypothetical protein